MLLVSAGNYPLLLTFGTSCLVESARVSFGQGTVPRRGKLVLLVVVWMCKSSFAEHALCLIAVLLAMENGVCVNSLTIVFTKVNFFFSDALFCGSPVNLVNLGTIFKLLTGILQTFRSVLPPV